MRNTEISHILHAAYSVPWAIEKSKLDEIFAFLAGRASSVEVSTEERQKLLAAAEDRQRFSRDGAIAVIPVFGTIAQRISMLMASSGGTSTEQLTKQIRASVADPDVYSIVLNIDSPGGTVEGVPEAFAEILKARDVKPIIASVNSRSGSAAYWLAAAASEIVITPSGLTGSVGVFMKHEDLSAMAEKEGVKITYISAGDHKVDGNPFEPLSDDARDYFQKLVDSTYEMFVRDIAKGRGVTTTSVKENYGKGRMLLAKDALAAGMVDKIESFDATVTRLSRGGSKPGRKAEEFRMRTEHAGKFL